MAAGRRPGHVWDMLSVAMVCVAASGGLLVNGSNPIQGSLPGLTGRNLESGRWQGAWEAGSGESSVLSLRGGGLKFTGGEDSYLGRPQS